MWRVNRWAPLFFCLLQSVPGKNGPPHPRSRAEMWVLGHPGTSGTLCSRRRFAWSQNETILSLSALSGKKGAGFREAKAGDI